MKQSFLIISILISVLSPCVAQEVTCVELISMTKCQDFSCFSDFISKKQFCYEKTNKSEYGSTYQFSSCDFIKNGPKSIDTKNQASIMFIVTGSISASIGTSSSEYYQRLLNQISSLGFIAYETDDSEENTLMVNYKSTKYPKVILGIMTTKIKKQYVGDWTFWSISFRRDK